MSTSPSGDLAVRLRPALVAARFTTDAVAELLGPRAHEALARHETTPGLRRTTGGSPRRSLQIIAPLIETIWPLM